MRLSTADPSSYVVLIQASTPGSIVTSLMGAGGVKDAGALPRGNTCRNLSFIIKAPMVGMKQPYDGMLTSWGGPFLLWSSWPASSAQAKEAPPARCA